MQRWQGKTAEHRVCLEFSFVSFLFFKKKKRKSIALLERFKNQVFFAWI